MFKQNGIFAKSRRSGFQTNNSLRPRKLLVYYGNPMSFNSIINNNNIENVVRDMAQYDDIILGAGLELETPKIQNQLVSIIRHVKQKKKRVKFYGHIPLGMLNWNNKYDMYEIANIIDTWKRIGAKGIFFDEFGFDYSVTRERQNEAVSYAKENGLLVAFNGWNPDHIFSSDINVVNNPNGTHTVLGEKDFYLMDSFVVKDGLIDSYDNFNWKQERINMYRKILKFGLWSVTTNSRERATIYEESDEVKWNYAWYLALINDHNSTGWGEFKFSCCEPNNHLSSFRQRPNSNIGSKFTSNIFSSIVNGDRILTRKTDTGKIIVNTTNHIATFEPFI